jgi:hypothetical protein
MKQAGACPEMEFAMVNNIPRSLRNEAICGLNICVKIICSPAYILKVNLVVFL